MNLKDKPAAEPVNCDNFSLLDFSEFLGEDLVEVKEPFWDFYQDAIDKKYIVYGNPVTSAPASTFNVYDRYSQCEREFLNFCFYNYLGYSYHPEVVREVQDTITKYGTGAVSAPLLSGYYDLAAQLEEQLAHFKNKEGALIFPTGYGANLGVLSCLLKPGDVAILDILSHAFIYDGARSTLL